MSLILPDDLAQQIEHIAEQERRSPIEVIQSWLEHYQSTPSRPIENDPLDKITGIFSDNISDMSDSVRSTLSEFYRKKYESTD